MIRLILILCLVPSLAFAEASILKLWDGSTYCGKYYKTKTAYCRMMSGGEICWSRKEVVSIKKVEDCDSFVEKGPTKAGTGEGLKRSRK